MAQTDPDELRQRVAALRWFHTIDLGDGIVTPGFDESPKKLKRLQFPESFAGKTVLDIGAWDGFFSFEAERRGASHVTSVDPACWGEPAWGDAGWGTRRPFDLAHETLGSAVEPREIDSLESIGPSTLGRFDVVFFLGVLYHLPDPWPILAAAASVASETLIIETHVDLLNVREPAAAYYPATEVGNDPSNYWGPNTALLVAKLRELGFRRMVVHGDSYAYRLARSAYRRVRPPRVSTAQGRRVIHAHR